MALEFLHTVLANLMAHRHSEVPLYYKHWPGQNQSGSTSFDYSYDVIELHHVTN